MDLTDLFDEPGSKNVEPPRALDGDLPEALAKAAKTAVEAHDKVREAQAEFDNEQAKLHQEFDDKIASHKKTLVEAKEARKEAVTALEVAMGEEKITQIPMTDRPDIKIKVTNGSKKSISKGWLVNPENVAVKSFDAALKGESPFKSGVEAAQNIWDSSPKNKDKSEVVIPNRYEDEPGDA